ncbi:hypothetical protein DPMN_001753 [Dreissena polymorpha]|uniref:G-protein coupled receptors family 1 profile domain-containing protein n=1 Tax=Dreissena polymorpha TaxID=45954 RepID=A0A9D4RR46_DREPO|nr:hypothetical protein DPMN_001753 [Dreissena polymorpha]
MQHVRSLLKQRKTHKPVLNLIKSNLLQHKKAHERIFETIRQWISVNATPTRTSNRKITLMIVLMAVASFLAFTPYFVIRQTTSLKKYEYPLWMALLFHAYVIHSSVNPFIIGSCNSKFRAYVKNIRRCRSVK